jgi:hypothetical protein
LATCKTATVPVAVAAGTGVEPLELQPVHAITATASSAGRNMRPLSGATMLHPRRSSAIASRRFMLRHPTLSQFLLMLNATSGHNSHSYQLRKRPSPRASQSRRHARAPDAVRILGESSQRRRSTGLRVCGLDRTHPLHRPLRRLLDGIAIRPRFVRLAKILGKLFTPRHAVRQCKLVASRAAGLGKRKPRR